MYNVTHSGTTQHFTTSCIPTQLSCSRRHAEIPIKVNPFLVGVLGNWSSFSGTTHSRSRCSRCSFNPCTVQLIRAAVQFNYSRFYTCRSTGDGGAGVGAYFSAGGKSIFMLPPLIGENFLLLLFYASLKH